MRPATCPMRAAPAVCELDGPIMTGPMISKIPISHSPYHLSVKSVREVRVTLFHNKNLPQRADFLQAQSPHG